MNWSLVNPNVKFWILFGMVVIKASRPLTKNTCYSSVDCRSPVHNAVHKTAHWVPDIGEKGFRTGHVSNLVHGKDGTSANLGSVCSKIMYGMAVYHSIMIVSWYLIALSPCTTFQLYKVINGDYDADCLVFYNSRNQNLILSVARMPQVTGPEVTMLRKNWSEVRRAHVSHRLAAANVYHVVFWFWHSETVIPRGFVCSILV